MPSARYIKLGLLTVLLAGALVTVAIVLGLRTPPRELYTTYFDESVQGLDVGATVKYRGLLVGRVEEIGIAPDGRRIAVQMAIRSEFADRIGLPEVAPQLRAQLVLQSISGIKLVELDWPTPGTVPAPTLSFTPPRHYIPSRTSVLTDVERRVRDIEQHAPEFFDRVGRAIMRIEEVLAEARAEKLVARIGAAADAATATLTEVRRLARQSRDVPARATRTLRTVERAADKASKLVDDLGGKDGLVAQTTKTARTVDNVGAGILESVDELERTLRAVHEAARALRQLLALLEREPDALLKGRRRTNPS